MTTGRRFVAVAGAGAWLLADEVYAGAERSTAPPNAATRFGTRAEKVIAVGALSKVMRLPGLRATPGWSGRWR